MQLTRGIHLAYCTNIHRGETWDETFAVLKSHTLAVKARVSPRAPYAIGLRLSAQAARTLSDRARLSEFQRWLDAEGCYVFTINGFPYGQFHGVRVKEQVYRPDWTTQDRLDYTRQLFDLIAELAPVRSGGSISTVPVSFKEFGLSAEQRRAAGRNLWACVDHIATLSQRTGKDLHLGLEPEPLCTLETSAEMVEFMAEMRAMRPGDERIDRHLGINYDACHLACQFEDANTALDLLQAHRVRVSKLHLSAALLVRPVPPALDLLRGFADDTYFHQVIARSDSGEIRRTSDLPQALALLPPEGLPGWTWAIHYHVPLHSSPTQGLHTTAPHLHDLLARLGSAPGLCSHLEMETYTWEVLPAAMKSRDVVDQLEAEYRWVLSGLQGQGIVPEPVV